MWDRNNRMVGNNEIEVDYTAKTAYVANGKLNLVSTVSLNGKDYIVPASVTTMSTMSFKYGYVEMRAKVPFGKGLWPSFWAMSLGALNSKENPSYTIEVDIFEQFASENGVRSNLHKWYEGETESKQYSANEKVTYTFSAEETAQYHTYGFLWTETQMVMYIDGQPYMTYKIQHNTDPYDKGKLDLGLVGVDKDWSGFDTTLALILNNHLFTASSDYKPYNGCEAELGDLNGEYTIDYIRLYQTTGGQLNTMVDGRLVTVTKE